MVSPGSSRESNKADSGPEAGQAPASVERIFGRIARKLIEVGNTDPDRYERFTIRMIDFRRGQDIPLARPGDRTINTEPVILWLCFPGIAIEYPSPLRRLFLGRWGMIPKEGIAFIFDGPAAIVGYTPDQCLRATEEVKGAVEGIVARKR